MLPARVSTEHVAIHDQGVSAVRTSSVASFCRGILEPLAEDAPLMTPSCCPNAPPPLQRVAGSAQDLWDVVVPTLTSVFTRSSDGACLDLLALTSVARPAAPSIRLTALALDVPEVDALISVAAWSASAWSLSRGFRTAADGRGGVAEVAVPRLRALFLARDSVVVVPAVVVPPPSPPSD